MMRRTTVLLAILVCLATAGVAGWAGGKSATFGFVCAKPGLPPELKPIVAKLMTEHSDGGVAWGDRTVSVQLRRGSPPAHFVPLTCGATGNCTWAILALSPARSLGVASGAVVVTSVASRDWPMIIAFGALGTAEGVTETLTFAGDSYKLQKTARLDATMMGMFSGCIDNEACCPKLSGRGHR